MWQQFIFLPGMMVQVARSTIQHRRLQDAALSTFLEDTPFHEFGQWLIDEQRWCARVVTGEA